MTLYKIIVKVSDEEEDDFIGDMKVLIKLKTTVPPSPDFLENLKVTSPCSIAWEDNCYSNGSYHG
jgi:hypothetical protein